LATSGSVAFSASHDAAYSLTFTSPSPFLPEAAALPFSSTGGPKRRSASLVVNSPISQADAR
jgi:hypothetical protein